MLVWFNNFGRDNTCDFGVFGVSSDFDNHISMQKLQCRILTQTLIKFIHTITKIAQDRQTGDCESVVMSSSEITLFNSGYGGIT